MKLLLVNPNTNAATTASMQEIAQHAAPAGVSVLAATAAFGASLILEPKALARSAEAVMALIAAGIAPDIDGIVIAAFGDPALREAREASAIPVTGIAEAGMSEAAAGGRRFAVVTTTPGLVESIAGLAALYGHERLFLGTELTHGDALSVTNDAAHLPGALLEACLRAVSERGAEAIVIGGGPLAVAARAIAAHISVPIIEPVPAAIRLAVARVKGTA